MESDAYLVGSPSHARRTAHAPKASSRNSTCASLAYGPCMHRGRARLGWPPSLAHHTSSERPVLPAITTPALLVSSSRALCALDALVNRVSGFPPTLPGSPTAPLHGHSVPSAARPPSSWRGRPRGAGPGSHKGPASVLQVVSRRGAKSLIQ